MDHLGGCTCVENWEHHLEADDSGHYEFGLLVKGINDILCRTNYVTHAFIRCMWIIAKVSMNGHLQMSKPGEPASIKYTNILFRMAPEELIARCTRSIIWPFLSFDHPFRPDRSILDAINPTL
jgi:hypothetical protein